VIIRPKDWNWKGHLLRGALELLTGIPGLGKSQVQNAFVACVTTGKPWPDGSPAKAPMKVIMVTAEDTLDREVVPRLIAAGANLHNVCFLKKIKQDKQKRMLLLGEDIEVLKQVIRDVGDVGLVTLDPITAFMGKLDSHRATDVRGQLGPLADLAEETDVAFSAVTHPPKHAGQKAIDHFIGSQAFIAAARIGHLCVEEIETGEDGKPVRDEGGQIQTTGRVLFTNPKNNPHLKMPTLAYKIEQTVVGQDEETKDAITAPYVVWDATPMSLTADQAIGVANAREEKERGPDVKAFLEGVLANGPLPEQKIEELAAGRNISIDQLKRAKKKLGVVSEKLGLAEWQWSLPPVAARDKDDLSELPF
jgi:hypothetical protein